MPIHPAAAELFTLSLHDALPICGRASSDTTCKTCTCSWSCTKNFSRGSTDTLTPTCLVLRGARGVVGSSRNEGSRSEEHTSELQSREKLVCRLLLEKKRHEP